MVRMSMRQTAAAAETVPPYPAIRPSRPRRGGGRAATTIADPAMQFATAGLPLTGRRSRCRDRFAVADIHATLPGLSKRAATRRRIGRVTGSTWTTGP